MRNPIARRVAVGLLSTALLGAACGNADTNPSSSGDDGGQSVSGVGRRQTLVLQHAGEDQEAARTAVAAVGSHVVGVAIHQPLERARAPADAGRERGRELPQLLPPPVADIDS